MEACVAPFELCGPGDSCCPSTHHGLGPPSTTASELVGAVYPFGRRTMLVAHPESLTSMTISDTLTVMLSMGCGSALMIAILGRYIHSRRKLLSFDARPVDSTNSSKSQNSTTLTGSSTTRRHRRSIYDRWLMTRFTIAFVLLA